VIEQSSQALKYRILWTWDRLICDRTEKSFLGNYKKLIDYMSDHDLNGVILWGFLDDQHGGEEAARELCEYAYKKDVRILPGVGVNIYNGVYCDGEHEFNLQTHLRNHPELRAIGKDGKPVPSDSWVKLWGCPSKKENMAWMKRGLEWLFKNFNPGGLNLQAFEGPYGMCWCDDCRKISESTGATDPNKFNYLPPNREILYQSMMLWLSKTLPSLIETVKRVAPDTLVTYDTFINYWTTSYPPETISAIPENAYCQWIVTGMFDTFDPPEGAKPPTKRNIGFSYYFGSNHLERAYTQPTYSFSDHFCDWSFRRFHPYIHKIRGFCKTCAEQGLDGAITQGTGLATVPDNEINYIGFGEFSSDPDMTVDEFWSKHLPSLYGEKIVDEVKEVMTTAEEYEPLYIKYYNWLGKPLFWWPDPGKIIWKNEISRDDWEAISKDWQSLSQKTKTNLKTAKKAIKRANEGGKSRLEKIIMMLTEYYVFATQLYPAARPFLEAENKAHFLVKKAESLLNRGERQEALKLYESALQLKKQNSLKLEAITKLLRKQPVNQKIYLPKRIEDNYQKTVKDLTNYIKREIA
jgi:hypothetical protein